MTDYNKIIHRVVVTMWNKYTSPHVIFLNFIQINKGLNILFTNFSHKCKNQPIPILNFQLTLLHSVLVLYFLILSTNGLLQVFTA